jgi:hypothetical protein
MQLKITSFHYQALPIYENTVKKINQTEVNTDTMAGYSTSSVITNSNLHYVEYFQQGANH